jgi:hypothetical protein
VFITPRLVDTVHDASILPICEGHPSDHWALVVDFDATLMFGDTTTVVVPGSTRPLTSKSRRAVSPYIKEMKKHFEDNDILARVEELATASRERKWSKRFTVQHGILDHLLEEGRSRSEKKCPSKRSGAYPYSPDLVHAMSTYFYWILR